MDCQNIAISEGHQMLDGEHLVSGFADAEGWTDSKASEIHGGGSDVTDCRS